MEAAAAGGSLHVVVEMHVEVDQTGLQVVQAGPLGRLCGPAVGHHSEPDHTQTHRHTQSEVQVVQAGPLSRLCGPAVGHHSEPDHTQTHRHTQSEVQVVEAGPLGGLCGPAVGHHSEPDHTQTHTVRGTGGGGRAARRALWPSSRPSQRT